MLSRPPRSGSIVRSRESLQRVVRCEYILSMDSPKHTATSAQRNHTSVAGTYTKVYIGCSEKLPEFSQCRWPTAVSMQLSSLLASNGFCRQATKVGVSALRLGAIPRYPVINIVGIWKPIATSCSCISTPLIPGIWISEIRQCISAGLLPLRNSRALQYVRVL